MELFEIIINTFKNIHIINIIDILVVSLIFYKIYGLIRETRAEQLLKGILLVLFIIPISDLLNLTMLHWILNKTITIGVITIVIIFQPEIRRALEKIGRTTFLEKHVVLDEQARNEVATEIVTAVEGLSDTRTGALILIEQQTGLGELINTGTKIDAVVSAALLENIFVVNTPLHDGACIIRNNRIIAGGCFLPLSSNDKISKKLGTRHRAALGASETSDAIVIVVSEETGMISLAINGKLLRNYNGDKLKKVLLNIMGKEDNKNIRERVKSWIKTKREK